MIAFRLLPFLLVLACVQLGLFLTLRELFLPRPDQVWARRWLALALAALALFFVGFMTSARIGLVAPAPLRTFVLEPLLAAEALSIPLMLLLGLGLSIAKRLPKTPSERRSLEAAAGESEQRSLEDPAASSRVYLPEPRRKLLARAATGILGLAAATAAAGIAEAELDPVLTRLDIPIPGLHPDLDGLTIVQLSDIHAGTLMTEARMLRIARAAAALQADLVVFTGDLLDASAKAGAPFSRAFRDLQGRLGTFAIFGNHDYFAGADVAARAIRDANATLLRNSGARIERGRGSLFIGGVDDPSHGSLGVDPVSALKAAAPEEPRIVLAHRPSLFEACSAQGASLVLSGHTHGGQFALSPRWSLARMLGPHTMGLYQTPRGALYVHRGMGTVGAVPLRLGSPPELALLTLRRV
ncbi:MAG TPA: metallophosphoesterase [Myxococcales bacterium]|nr:metallophosphoesterase [Myxococcales bacterium]